MGTDETGQEYTDNGERAIFFARGVLETVKKLRWQPDVIICQGWMSAVAPLYIKTAFAEEPSFANTKVISALYTNELKGQLGDNFSNCVDFREAKSELLEGYKTPFDFTELANWLSTTATVSLREKPTFRKYCFSMLPRRRSL